METVRCFAKGFRTLLAVLAFLVTGLLSVFGALDLTPIVSLFVKDPAMLGAAMVGVAALFGWLRYVTTTPMFQKHDAPAADEAPESGERPRSLDSGV